MERAIEHIAFRKSAPHRIGCIDNQRMILPEREQAQAVIQIPIGEKDGLNRRVPRVPRMERFEAFDLNTDVRRGIDQEPVSLIRTDADRFLSARAGFNQPLPQTSTIRAAAVPLREPSAGR